jgi:hypothetical protein
MRRFVVELTAAIILTLGAIIASATGVNASDVMVMDAFARASATPMAKSGAAYLTIANRGAAAERLLSVSSPAANMAEFHEQILNGDVMTMRPAGALQIPANGTLKLSPGGIHVMLMGLRAPLKQGSTIELTLVFERAGEIKIAVPVGAVAEGEHDHVGGSSSGN